MMKKVVVMIGIMVIMEMVTTDTVIMEMVIMDMETGITIKLLIIEEDLMMIMITERLSMLLDLLRED